MLASSLRPPQEEGRRALRGAREENVERGNRNTQRMSLNRVEPLTEPRLRAPRQAMLRLRSLENGARLACDDACCATTVCDSTYESKYDFASTSARDKISANLVARNMAHFTISTLNLVWDTLCLAS